jgi:hypothetical protein
MPPPPPLASSPSHARLRVRVATRGQGAPHAWPPSPRKSPRISSAPALIAERRSRLASGRPALRACGAFLAAGARRSRSSDTGCGGRLGASRPAASRQRERRPSQWQRETRPAWRCGKGHRCPARPLRARTVIGDELHDLARSREHGGPVSPGPPMAPAHPLAKPVLVQAGRRSPPRHPTAQFRRAPIFFGGPGNKYTVIAW